MNPVLIQALFQHVLLPELSRWLSRRGAADPFPTKEQILAELDKNAATVINAGEDWLRKMNAL